MTSLTKYLEEIEGKLSKAAPAPWQRTGTAVNLLDIASYSVPMGERHVCSLNGLEYNPKHIANADLIAAAPTALATLIKIVKVQSEALDRVCADYGTDYFQGGLAVDAPEIAFNALTEIEKIVSEK